MAPRKRKSGSTEEHGTVSKKRSQVKAEPDMVNNCLHSIATRRPRHQPLTLPLPLPLPLPVPLPVPLPLPLNEVSLVGKGSPQSPPELPPLQIFCPDCFSVRRFHAVVPLYQAPWAAFVVPLLIPITPGFPNQNPETVSVPTHGSLSRATTTTERLSNGTTLRTTTVFTSSPSMIYYRFTPTISVALASTTTNTVVTPIQPPGPPQHTRQVKVHSFIHTCHALPTCPAGSPCPWITRPCTSSAGEGGQSEDEGLGQDECQRPPAVETRV